MKDRNVQEAGVYIGKWGEAMAARWEVLHQRAVDAGFTVSTSLKTLPVEEVGHVLIEREGKNLKGAVRVVVEGTEYPLHEAVLIWGFHLERLEEVRKMVVSALDRFEKELDQKLELLPALVHEFGADAVDHALERRVRL